jgi:hypothetical protein
VAGLIKEDAEKLKKVFLQGIENVSRKISYEDIIESRSHEFPVEGQRSEEYLEIKKSIDEHALKLREAHHVKACTQLLDLLPDQFEEFRTRYFGEDQKFLILPIFKYYPERKLFNKIVRLSTQNLYHFTRMIKGRYKDPNFAPDLREEYTNIKALLISIDTLTEKKKRKTIRLHWLKELAVILRRECERLKPAESSAPKT